MKKKNLAAAVLAAGVGVAGIAHTKDANADLVCDPGTKQTHFTLSSNVHDTLAPLPIVGAPGGEGTLDYTQLVIREDNPPEQKVYILDRKTGVFTETAGPAEVTYFDKERGHLNGNICTTTEGDESIIADSSILINDVYTDTGALIGVHTSGLVKRQGTDGLFMNGVTNNDLSKNYNVFNESGAELIQTTIETDLGTTVERLTAQNVVSDTQGMLGRGTAEKVLFNNPSDAVILQGYVAITGENPTVTINPEIGAVNGDGTDVVSDGIVDLVAGETIYLQRQDGSTMPVPVIDARVGATVIEGTCTNGKANVSATQTYDSPVKKEMTLNQNGVVDSGESIDAVVNCNEEYTLLVQSTDKDLVLDSETYTGTIAGEEWGFVGVSIDNNNTAEYFDANGDGIIDGAPFDINCNSQRPKQLWIVMDPPISEKTYTFTENNAPNGWEIKTPNLIEYKADCQDANKTVTPQIIASDGTTQKGLTIPYAVRNE